MPDTELWHKLDALAVEAQGMRERLVRIEAGADHRDEKLDRQAAAIADLQKRTADIQALLHDMNTRVEMARWIANTGKVGLLGLGGVVVAYWQQIKKWLP